MKFTNVKIQGMAVIEILNEWIIRLTKSECIVSVLLTSFKKPSLLELLEAELFRSNPYQGDPIGPQVRLQFADLWRNPAAHLAAKPAQEEEHHGLLLPQRLQLHALKHNRGEYPARVVCVSRKVVK